MKVRGYIIRFGREYPPNIEVSIPDKYVWGRDDLGIWCEIEIADDSEEAKSLRAGFVDGALRVEAG